MNVLAKPAELLLIQQIDQLPDAARVLATSVGRAQLATALAASGKFDAVDCWYLDLFRSKLAPESGVTDGLQILCQTDAPNAAYDLAMLPLSHQGEADLARDQLQQCFERLTDEGEMWVSVDNPTDRWVRQQIQRFDVAITTVESDRCVAYRCRRQGPLKKRKNYDCEFAFRDNDHLIKAFSRPGVFSHRRIDPGARHLINAMHIEEGARVLEIGSGTGTVSAAVAFRSRNVKVVAIDSHSRAVQCTARTAELNGIQESVSAILTSDGNFDSSDKFDCVVANPPYYADFQVASFFLDTAFRWLQTGGKLFVVGKDRKWYEETLPERFKDVRLADTKGYVIGEATR